jgi:hypothetical protein
MLRANIWCRLTIPKKKSKNKIRVPLIFSKFFMHRFFMQKINTLQKRIKGNRIRRLILASVKIFGEQ